MENVEAVEMGRELYVAAMEGDANFIHAQNHEVLLRKTRQNYNLIHIATRHEQLIFIETSLRKLRNNYKLIFDQENSHKNTPLHVAAEVGNLDIMSELYEYSRIVERGEGDKEPWLLKNSKGNTAVHVALIHGNVMVARFLLDRDLKLAFIDNDAKEAPLHIAIKQHVNYSESESLMARMKQPINKGGAGLMINCTAEKMSSMIEFLIEKASSVASFPDSKGVTPLHRAASLVTPYNLDITKRIIGRCPQSADVFDGNDKSILHLLINKVPTLQEGKNLLNIKAIHALRNHQDQHGNTPLHLAAKYKDMIMVRVLLEYSTKINIRNSDNLCATSLIQQQRVFQMLRQRNFTNEESEAAFRANITFLMEKVENLGADFVLSKDSKGRNVLHKLLQIKNEHYIKREKLVEFIQKVVGIHPPIVCETDQNGDTPVHILVRNHLDTKIYYADNQNNAQLNNSDGNPDDMKYEYKSLRGLGLLLELLKIFREVDKEASNKPWLVQNANGNTPLHEAVKATNYQLVMELVEYENESVGLQNKNLETPLHLLASNPPHMEPLTKDDIKKMLDASSKAATLLDHKCLTPLLSAFKKGNLALATILCILSPKAAETPDADGQTFVHLLVQHPSNYFLFRILRNPHLKVLLRDKEKKHGNTLLHLTIERNRFDLVKVFLDTWEEKRETELRRGENKWLVELFKIPNKVGKTPADLIAESVCLPPDIAKSIGNKEELIGVRSIWGIPTSNLKTYVNTMGIIAALLTTITFTTAFTVPGGVIQDEGTPVLVEHAAYQVFMISDVLAMCLSMMVLFCLLWIMAKSDTRHNSVMLLDLSVALLLASFYATLMTFMSGLFATLFPVKPWIAIVSLVLCSVFTVLVHKLLVIKLLIPFSKNILSSYWKFRRFVSKRLKECFNIRACRGADSRDLRSHPQQHDDNNV